MSFYHDDELIPWQMWILEALGVFFCVILFFIMQIMLAFSQ